MQAASNPHIHQFGAVPDIIKPQVTAGPPMAHCTNITIQTCWPANTLSLTFMRPPFSLRALGRLLLLTSEHPNHVQRHRRRALSLLTDSQYHHHLFYHFLPFWVNNCGCMECDNWQWMQLTFLRWNVLIIWCSTSFLYTPYIQAYYMTPPVTTHAALSQPSHSQYLTSFLLFLQSIPQNVMDIAAVYCQFLILWKCIACMAISESS